MDRFRRVAPLLYLLLLPLLPLWRAVFLGEAIGPFDQIRHMAPWAAPAPDQPWDVLQADGALQFYEWRTMVLDSWGKGQIPGWNPYELAGTPLLANSQSAGFYPPLMVLGFLHVPPSLAITLLAWFHLFWAGLGVYYLVRSLGGRRTPAAMAGGLFSCSTFMLGWTALSSVIFTCSWIPWALACLIVLHGYGRFRIQGTLGLGLSVAMMFLGGHLQFAAFGCMALALVWCVKLLDRHWAASAIAVLTMLCGVGLSAPQLFPSLAYSKFSHRRNVPTEEGYAAYTALAIKPFELANLATPTALGNPRSFSSLEKPRISTYWPVLVKPGANLAESAITVGPLLLLLLFLVPWRNRRYWPMGKLLALGLLIALGTPFDRLLYFLVPGWSATGSPGRAIVLFVLAACVFGGMLLSEDELPKWTQNRMALILALLATLLPLALCQLGNLPQQAGFLLTEAATGGLIDWGVGVVVAGACLLLYKQWRGILLLAPLGSMLTLMWVLIPTGKPLAPVAAPDHSERVAVINDRWDILTNPGALLPPNTAALSSIHELGGYDSLLHVDTVNLLKQVDGGDPAPPANGNMMFIGPKASHAALAEAGVTEIWSLKPDPDDPTGRRKLPELEKSRLRGPGRVASSGGEAKIIGEGYDRLAIRAKGPGTLIVRDRNMPGWTATVAGTPTAIAGSMWRVIELPDGDHEVYLRYMPPGMHDGILVALVSLLILVVTPLLTALRRPTYTVSEPEP